MSKDEDSSSAATVAPKTYTHVQPRVDPEWYQAEIPLSYEGPLPTEGR